MDGCPRRREEGRPEVGDRRVEGTCVSKRCIRKLGGLVSNPEDCTVLDRNRVRLTVTAEGRGERETEEAGTELVLESSVSHVTLLRSSEEMEKVSSDIGRLFDEKSSTG